MNKQTWLERSRLRLKQEGFDYAAGELLRGRNPDELEVEADTPFDRNEFDRGMKDAIRAFAQLKAAEMTGAPLRAEVQTVEDGTTWLVGAPIMTVAGSAKMTTEEIYDALHKE